MAEDVTQKENLGRFIHIRPNAIRQLKSKAAEREVPLHTKLEQLGYFPATARQAVSNTHRDKVVKAYAATAHLSNPTGTVFHSTRKWFISVNA